MFFSFIYLFVFVFVPGIAQTSTNRKFVEYGVAGGVRKRDIIVSANTGAINVISNRPFYRKSIGCRRRMKYVQTRFAKLRALLFSRARRLSRGRRRPCRSLV